MTLAKNILSERFEAKNFIYKAISRTVKKQKKFYLKIKSKIFMCILYIFFGILV